MDDSTQVGLCRRNPPTPILVNMATAPTGERVPIVIGFFPQTRPDVLCGEFRGRALESGRPLPDLADMDLVGRAQ